MAQQQNDNTKQQPTQKLNAKQLAQYQAAIELARRKKLDLRDDPRF
jgi:hypothetical protein